MVKKERTKGKRSRSVTLIGTRESDECQSEGDA